ncbi:SgcJ/EcaC family oxidoreductase [Hymenobacter lucidus]|uniref:SgcJ/EcaC family oxidoreductase n=1 Tax=Hymenobacter lucidus TaxID=2880930 RepID=A0ABS8ARK9_9BACT|nr:SgcJ/EcaC family oxidoreductase [Hymenobacter lucidus]MCB2407627.1 SgcJ/EcaC family oxidoreductase [Hymenobacter lucidus]
MKKLLLFSLAGLLASQLSVAQTTAAPPLPAADEAAVRTLVSRMMTNWNAHQFADMATYTTDDVSWVNIVGMWWQGRPQVQQAHQAIFDAIFKGVTFKPGALTLRAITPDVVVANQYCSVGAYYPPDGVNRGTNKMGDDQDLVTLVLVKRQGKWLLTAGHNTVVDARAAANNPVKMAAK